MADLLSRLEEYRIDMGMGKRQKGIFARRIGLTPQAYSNYTGLGDDQADQDNGTAGAETAPPATGFRKPDLPTLIQMSRAMVVTLDWLTGESDYPKWASAVTVLQMLLKQKAPDIRAVDVIDRFRQLVKLCLAESPIFAPIEEREWFMIGILGLNGSGYHKFIAGEDIDLGICLRRFSRFTGLSMKWLQTGDIRDLTPELLPEYIFANIEARRLGISNEDLLKLLPAMKPILDSMKQ